jgi:hypothetical protein
MSVQTRKFEFQKDVPVEEINRFYQESNIDRTQILNVQVIQKTPNAGVYMITYEDIIQPYVVGTSPANGASGVPAGTQIIVQFSEAVQPVLAVDVEVTRNGVPVVVVDGDIVTSGAKVTISNMIDTTYGASYVVTLKTSIEDLNGNNMAQPYVLQFTAISQINALIKKGGNVTPDAGDIAAGYINIAFVASMPDANYRLDCQLVGILAQPGVGLRVSNKTAAGFRINFDKETFSTVETGINNAMAALATAIDTAHTTQINTQHANVGHAAPQNALTGLSTTSPGGAACADRDFQLGNSIDWEATYGLTG